ncbi:DUF6722 family protein [Bacteroides thetaiotaomicron]|uniref:DUF6722 family protein n=1 Tax=Bacteroides thetaiotaomicron TaxID=818 RepID=UPI002166697C|nr:DUF6722 family protein [Bacteroides thetaiotaomicron]MCS2487388.1 hypothetical protein [Bacteroides thetaiotaomicron]
MKKEFGKWLMDVAKYMTTALLLSSAFGDMENPWVITSVIIASAATLGAGLWLVRNKRKRRINYGSISSTLFS